ncbi:RsmD family RNA methyltransferase (plasmid) [Candidatus Chlorohelix allophototropha]|uniref:Methyltransferase n=1 Tax=Candidatus Chlorohelix allophototropha TaxID=3003348 RepID=A0ABY9BB31_9CHLR|nr:RsmD family RNA methyltransferase [Chloroflexota bacterium L227-S17]
MELKAGIEAQMEIDLDKIRTDGGSQTRASLNEFAIGEYALALQNGDNFPPIVIFFDGSDYWLADGFHRYSAALSAGITSLPGDFRMGTRREAILYSVGANTTHGLMRTNADKRRAVETLLTDAEWQQWSNREIADKCHVTHTFVNNMRQELSGNGFQISTPRLATRNGTTYQINTANIGKMLNSPIADDPQERKEFLRLVPALQGRVAELLSSGAAPSVREARRALEREELEATPTPIMPATCMVEQRDNILHVTDGSVDLVLVDPPYNISGGGKLTKVGDTVIPADFDGNENWDTVPEYIFKQKLMEWTSEWARVLRPGGSLLVFTDRALVSQLWETMVRYSLAPKNIITWVKTNSAPNGLMRRNLISSTEFILWAVKPGARYTFNEVPGWDRRNVIQTNIISAQEKVDHPTQKPVSPLLTNLIQLTTHPGDLVLDNFAGSGSTGVAALSLGRQAHLIEQNAYYVKLARERIAGNRRQTV